ncbi:MAG: tetratricopeptide repeat protein [Planctomycetota bacterium]
MNGQRARWTSLLAVVLLAGVALGDEVNIGGLPRRGTVIGADGFSVTLRLSGGREVKSNVAEVREITLSGRTSFNTAEGLYADGKYAEAIQAYQRAARQADQKWLRRLIRYRQYLAMNKAGRINQAVEEWLGLVEEHERDSAILKARPTEMGKKGSKDNDKAIRLLEAKLEREKSGAFADAIKQVLLDLYRREGRREDAARLAGRTLVEDDDKEDDQPSNGSDTKPAVPRGDADKVIQAASITIEQAGDPDAKLTDAQRVAKASEALKSLQAKAKSFAMGDLAPALLWMGKAQLVIHDHGKDARKDLVEAGLNFMRVATFYTASTQTPEALFLAGQVNEKLGNASAARQAYAAVKEHFANTKFASKASKALDALDS